jgi:selenide,water dikinase
VTRRLVLLGGGHAHLLVLEGLATRPLAGVQTTLVSLDERQAYSGMVPGMIGGRYAPAELSFDLPAICRRAGVSFVRAEATRLAPGDRRVELAGGKAVEYDLLSVATGSTVEGAERPGVVQHARRVKPIGRALEIVPSLERAAAAPADPATVVVGGGAAGVEVALAARARLRKLGRPATTVTIVESGRRLLGGRMPAAEREVERALSVNQVTVRLGSGVAGLLSDGVRLDDGSELPARVVVWATGAAAPALLRESGLPVDRRGFLLVNDRLQSIGDPAVFAAGDAATIEWYPDTPKAGVYAVREGPVLWRNLLDATGGAAPAHRYRPQPRFLAILNTGDGKAVLSYGPLATWSAWAMTLKDRIDRRFMRRFHALERP